MTPRRWHVADGIKNIHIGIPAMILNMRDDRLVAFLPSGMASKYGRTQLREYICIAKDSDRPRMHLAYASSHRLFLRDSLGNRRNKKRRRPSVDSWHSH